MASKTCPTCQGEFDAPRVDSTYCSRACYPSDVVRRTPRYVSKYAKAQCAAASTSPTVPDMAWAAGFVEGEGNFTPLRVKGHSYERVMVAQVNREPLERMLALFGGNILKIHRNAPLKDGTKPFIWQWRASGARARGIMFTLFSFMSAKRKGQIKFALNGGYCGAN